MFIEKFMCEKIVCGTGRNPELIDNGFELNCI